MEPFVIASFTTIPARLERKLPARTIASLLLQSRPIDLILLNVPQVSRKGQFYNELYLQELEQLSDRVIVNRTDTDYGPITKLFGALQFVEATTELRSHTVKLMLVDDDCVYSKDALRQLLEVNAPAVGYEALAPGFWFGHNFFGQAFKDVVPVMDVFVLETYGSALYDLNVFVPFQGMFDWYQKLPVFASYADDIVIGAWLDKKKVKKVRLNYRREQPLSKYDPKDTPQLMFYNLANNHRVYAYFLLQGYFKEGQKHFIFAIMVIFLLIFTLSKYWSKT